VDNRQYRKFVLTKGFLIVQEKEITVSPSWLPDVSFFDTGCSRWFTLSGNTRPAFLNLIRQRFPAKENTEALPFAEKDAFSPNIEKYLFKQGHRQLSICLADPDASHDPIFIIGEKERKQILKALLELA